MVKNSLQQIDLNILYLTAPGVTRKIKHAFLHVSLRLLIHGLSGCLLAESFYAI